MTALEQLMYAAEHMTDEQRRELLAVLLDQHRRARRPRLRLIKGGKS